MTKTRDMSVNRYQKQCKVVKISIESFLQNGIHVMELHILQISFLLLPGCNRSFMSIQFSSNREILWLKLLSRQHCGWWGGTTLEPEEEECPQHMTYRLHLQWWKEMMTVNIKCKDLTSTLHSCNFGELIIHPTEHVNLCQYWRSLMTSLGPFGVWLIPSRKPIRLEYKVQEWRWYLIVSLNIFFD